MTERVGTHRLHPLRRLLVRVRQPLLYVRLEESTEVKSCGATVTRELAQFHIKKKRHELGDKGLVHPEKRFGSSVQSEDVLYRNIWRRPVHRVLKQPLLLALKVLQV